MKLQSKFYNKFIKIFIFYRVQKREAIENESTPQKRAAKPKDTQEQRRKQQVHSRMQVLLFRHKELLKKDILKKIVLNNIYLLKTEFYLKLIRIF